MKILSLIKMKLKKEKPICSYCGKEIKTNDSYGEEGGKFYHENCWIMYDSKKRVCNTCKSMIEDGEKYTKQMGLYFHRSCWKKERAAAPI